MKRRELEPYGPRHKAYRREVFTELIRVNAPASQCALAGLPSVDSALRSVSKVVLAADSALQSFCLQSPALPPAGPLVAAIPPRSTPTAACAAAAHFVAAVGVGAEMVAVALDVWCNCAGVPDPLLNVLISPPLLPAALHAPSDVPSARVVHLSTPLQLPPLFPSAQVVCPAAVCASFVHLQLYPTICSFAASPGAGPAASAFCVTPVASS